MTGKRSHGEGSITQRKDGIWQAMLTTPDGRKYVYAKTKRECQLKLRDALRNLEDGLPVVPKKQTVAEFLARWLEDVARPNTRPTVYIRYEQVCRVHIIPELGKIQLSQLSPQDVQRLSNLKLQSLSPRTVKHIHAILHNALNCALRWGFVARNVCEAVKSPLAPHSEMKYLNADQARIFIATAREARFEAVYVLAITTGLRQSELLGLKWEDIDLAAGCLRVVRNIQHVPRVGYVEGAPKSRTSRRTVTLIPVAVEALRRHRTAQLEARLAAGPIWNEHDLVFTNAVGNPLDADNMLKRDFYPLLEEAGLPRIRFHDLRHSAATLLLSLGAHPKVVQEILGHSQIAITMDLYSHSMPTLQQEVMAKLGTLLQAENSN